MNGLATHPLLGLSLCSGVGGLELGLRLAVPSYRTVCYVEREAFAAAVLVARMEDATLDQAPVWDDLATFDGAQFRGRVDLVTAGFPCQPFSQAGKRLGTDDPRWLWPHVFRIIREVGAGLVFLENVQGFVKRGMPAVFGDLASEGFDAEWDLFSAAELGAPHRRRRWFCLAAHPDCSDLREQLRGGGGEDGSGTDESPEHGSEGAATHPDCRGCEVEREPASARLDGTLRCDPDRRPGPWIADWQAGVEAGLLPEPAVRRVDDGTATVLYRSDRLRALGNAVVPAVAAHAFRTLARRLSER